MNDKLYRRAYFEYFSAARIFIEATERAGYLTGNIPLKNDDGSLKGWLVTWLR